ncbi:MAG: flagellar biosynthesis protein FlhF [Dyella sp.]
MKIKRFLAADMRQAMRDVREEQGADAVILSTRRLDDGIEIIAAVDYDEALVREAARHGAPMPDVGGVAIKATTPPPIPLPPSEVAQLQPIVEQSVLEAARMRVELGGLRELLEQQLSSLAWNDMERRRPMRARVLRDMTRLGIESDVARALVEELPEQLNADQARYLPLGVLSRNLKISGRDLAEEGGVTALVGPTGVGKTTTIAKLAARAVLRHGPGRVALVSTDNYRIGAAAQLEHYGRLLGVRVFPAHDAASLAQALHVLSDRHTVLIDTAGVAGSDPRLQQQMEVLHGTAQHGAGALRSCLVLAANAHASALDESVRAYLPLQPEACIVTKLDEAPSLGGVLSVLIRYGLALDYTTDGQRVPEDISAADARVLVCRAAAAQRGLVPSADDVEMAERFGMAVASL